MRELLVELCLQFGDYLVHVGEGLRLVELAREGNVTFRPFLQDRDIAAGEDPSVTKNQRPNIVAQLPF